MPLNTRLFYTYRDASNYKNLNIAVLPGALTINQREEVRNACSHEGGMYYFIPEQIGLPNGRFETDTEDDHCWCEFDSITLTTEPANLDMTAKELYEKFMGVKSWDEYKYAVLV